MQRLAAMEKQMLASPDQQISPTDPDIRSMATSGRGSGVVGYKVQAAVDIKTPSNRHARGDEYGLGSVTTCDVANGTMAVRQIDKLEAVADRGYFNGPEILACDRAGIAVTLPKPMTSGAKLEGRFGKQDFVYLA